MFTKFQTHRSFVATYVSWLVTTGQLKPPVRVKTPPVCSVGPNRQHLHALTQTQTSNPSLLASTPHSVVSTVNIFSFRFLMHPTYCTLPGRRKSDGRVHDVQPQNAPGPGAYEQRSSLGKSKMFTARGQGSPGAGGMHSKGAGTSVQRCVGVFKMGVGSSLKPSSVRFWMFCVSEPLMKPVTRAAKGI